MSDGRPTDPRHQDMDVAAVRLTLILVATAVFVALSALLVWGLMLTAWSPAAPSVAPSGGGALSSSAPAPRAELQALNDRAKQRLHGYGWVDRKAGIVHIPIDRAMDRLIRQSPGGGQ